MNKACDILEIERHKLIVSQSKLLLKLLQGDDAKAIEDILMRSKSEIDNHNNSARTICDITNIEDGKWRSTIKKVIIGKFTNYFRDNRALGSYPYGCEACNDSDVPCIECQKELAEYQAKREVAEKKRDAFSRACEKTVFPDDLKFKYIILCRRSMWPNQTPLELVLKELIHTEILSIFQSQNQELISTT